MNKRFNGYQLDLGNLTCYMIISKWSNENCSFPVLMEYVENDLKINMSMDYLKGIVDSFLEEEIDIIDIQPVTRGYDFTFTPEEIECYIHRFTPNIHENEIDENIIMCICGSVDLSKPQRKESLTDKKYFRCVQCNNIFGG